MVSCRPTWLFSIMSALGFCIWKSQFYYLSHYTDACVCRRGDTKVNCPKDQVIKFSCTQSSSHHLTNILKAYLLTNKF